MSEDEQVRFPPIPIPSVASIDPMRAWLAPRVPDDVLRWVAEANYGFGADEIFRAFKSQLSSGELPLIDGNPWECCLVASHSIDRLQPAHQELARAFACWSVLVTASKEDWVYLDNDSYRFLTHFVHSAIALGQGAPAAAFASLAWICGHIPPGEPRTLWRAGLLLLQAAEPRALFDRPIAEECREFAWRVDEELKRGVELGGGGSDALVWLGRYMWDTQSIEIWRNTARAVMSARSKAIDPSLGRICARIANNRWES